MQVLIVERNAGLASIWQSHLERGGAIVTVAGDQLSAVSAIRNQPFDVIVLDLVLPGESAIAVADYASYRQPGAKQVFVTSGDFFSGGALYDHLPTARAVLPDRTPPEDLAAIVDHYGRRN